MQDSSTTPTPCMVLCEYTYATGSGARLPWPSAEPASCGAAGEAGSCGGPDTMKLASGRAASQKRTHPSLPPLSNGPAPVGSSARHPAGRCGGACAMTEKIGPGILLACPHGALDTT